MFIETFIEHCLYFTDVVSAYEDKRDGHFEDKEENFDVSQFVDKECDENIDDKDGKENRFTGKASNASSDYEMDSEQLEETLNKLEEVFCFFPRQLIRRVLFRGDVKGDLEKASQVLQQFQGMEDPQDFFKKTPNSNPPEAKHGKEEYYSYPSDGVKSKKGFEQDECGGMRKDQIEGARQSFQGPKRRRRRNKNRRNDEELQGDFERNESEAGNQYQFYRHQDYLRARDFRGAPRGAVRGEHRGGGHVGGPRGGPYRGSREGQRGGCREASGYQYPGPQGNLSPQGYPAENKRRLMRGSRVVRGGWPRRGPWDGSAQNQGGYGCYVSHNQGRARHHVPVYLEDLEKASETYRSNEELGVHHHDAGQHAKDVKIGHDQGNQRGSRGKRGHGQRGMRRSQSMSCVEANQGYGNENDERFEENKLVICGLNAATTNESVVNFIEAMSGEEVKEVTMLGEAKALVTMAEPITSKSLSPLAEYTLAW